MKHHAITLLTRLPLPMLALAASYGVYSYNLLFVPLWVAVVSAAAFEMTYVALAFVSTHDSRRATAVAFAAVAVSVTYNTLAALFHRRPEVLQALPLWGDAVLAVLHGLPLAVVAYNVAVLLLHAPKHHETPAQHPVVLPATALPQPETPSELLLQMTVQKTTVEVSARALAKQLDLDHSKVYRAVKQIVGEPS